MSTILIAGGSGLIGQRLSAMLTEKGYRVTHLSRNAKADAKYKRYLWDVKKQTIDDEAILEADYIINLAGAGIVGAPWTKARKKLIIDSRVESTNLLLSSLKRLNKKPKAYLSSSAIGYYGDTGETLVDETTGPGEGFLSESCMAWEAAALQAKAQGLRTVIIRTGIVLSTQGGALEKMLISFNFFTGTYFGDGQQWYSWIHIDDICGMYIKAIEHDNMDGIYNGVAPKQVRNKELIVQIGKTMDKPVINMPVPRLVLRLTMGEMADTILFSNKVSAEKVCSAGFEFRFPALDAALGDILSRKV